MTRLSASERRESERVCEPYHGACALADMAVLRLYHHPTIATTTTITTTTTSTIAIGREHGRGGEEKSGVWRWMRLCCRVGVRQRGREETRRGKFDVRTRRINGCFLAEKGEESERGNEKATGKTVERWCGREREADLNPGIVGRIVRREGERTRGVRKRRLKRDDRCDDGGTRRENACQLDNSTSTSRPWLPPSVLSDLSSRSREGKRVGDVSEKDESFSFSNALL